MIQGYRNFELLGQGGSADVYRAWEDSLHRYIAIKVLRSGAGDDLLRSRFEREKALHARLASRGVAVAPVYRADLTDSGRPYVVMQLYDGSVHDWLVREGTTFTDAQATAVMLRITEAVQGAHDLDVVHGDIKPENILLSDTGPALADFGVAKVVPSDAVHPGEAERLTLRHAAPEVLDGSAPTRQSDVWSLGSTLYTMLGPRSPFEPRSGESLASFRDRVRYEPLPPILRDLDPGLWELIEAAMVKNPTERLMSAGEMHERLEAVAARHPRTEPPTLTVGATLVLPPVDANVPPGAAPLLVRPSALRAPAPAPAEAPLPPPPPPSPLPPPAASPLPPPPAPVPAPAPAEAPLPPPPSASPLPPPPPVPEAPIPPPALPPPPAPPRPPAPAPAEVLPPSAPAPPPSPTSDPAEAPLPPSASPLSPAPGTSVAPAVANGLAPEWAAPPPSPAALPPPDASPGAVPAAAEEKPTPVDAGPAAPASAPPAAAGSPGADAAPAASETAATGAPVGAAPAGDGAGAAAAVSAGPSGSTGATLGDRPEEPAAAAAREMAPRPSGSPGIDVAAGPVETAAPPASAALTTDWVVGPVAPEAPPGGDPAGSPGAASPLADDQAAHPSPAHDVPAPAPAPSPAPAPEAAATAPPWVPPSPDAGVAGASSPAPAAPPWAPPSPDAAGAGAASAGTDVPPWPDAGVAGASSPAPAAPPWVTPSPAAANPAPAGIGTDTGTGTGLPATAGPTAAGPAAEARPQPERWRDSGEHTTDPLDQLHTIDWPLGGAAERAASGASPSFRPDVAGVALPPRRIASRVALTLGGLLVVGAAVFGSLQLLDSDEPQGGPGDPDPEEVPITIPPSVPPAEVDPELEPTDFVVDDFGDTVDLHWTDHADGRLTYVVVYRAPGEEQEIVEVDRGATDLTIRGLDPDLGYCFRLLGVGQNTAGELVRASADASIRGCEPEDPPDG